MIRALCERLRWIKSRSSKSKEQTFIFLSSFFGHFLWWTSFLFIFSLTSLIFSFPSSSPFLLPLLCFPIPILQIFRRIWFCSGKQHPHTGGDRCHHQRSVDRDRRGRLPDCREGHDEGMVCCTYDLCSEMKRIILLHSYFKCAHNITHLRTHKQVDRNDPRTWDDPLWVRGGKHLGILGNEPCIGRCAWANRQNEKLYQVGAGVGCGLCVRVWCFCLCVVVFLWCCALCK